MKALPFIHQPDRMAQNASDASVADRCVSKKVILILHVSVTAFLRAGNPCETQQFI